MIQQSSTSDLQIKEYKNTFPTSGCRRIDIFCTLNVECYIEILSIRRYGPAHPTRASKTTIPFSNVEFYIRIESIVEMNFRNRNSRTPSPLWNLGLKNTLQICNVRYRGWLRLVGSMKLQVSFAEYSLFYRALLQKRRII